MEPRMNAWTRTIAGQLSGKGSFFKAAIPRPALWFSVLSSMVLVGSIFAPFAGGQSNTASIHFDSQAQVFRIDAADMSYVFGINEKKQLQALYWGKRLGIADAFAA